MSWFLADYQKRGGFCFSSVCMYVCVCLILWQPKPFDGFRHMRCRWFPLHCRNDIGYNICKKAVGFFETSFDSTTL
jgi:hypothetical protein